MSGGGESWREGGEREREREFRLIQSQEIVLLLNVITTTNENPIQLSPYLLLKSPDVLGVHLILHRVGIEDSVSTQLSVTKINLAHTLSQILLTPFYSFILIHFVSLVHHLKIQFQVLIFS